MNPQRFAVAAVLSFSAIYASDRIAWFTGIGSTATASTGAAHVVDRLAPSLAANVAATKTLPVPAPAAITDPGVSNANVATAAELLAEVAIAPKAQARLPAPDTQALVVVAALSNPAEVLPEAAMQVFERDCLVYLGTCIAPKGHGKPGKPCFTYQIDGASLRCWISSICKSPEFASAIETSGLESAPR